MTANCARVILLASSIFLVLRIYSAVQVVYEDDSIAVRLYYHGQNEFNLPDSLVLSLDSIVVHNKSMRTIFLPNIESRLELQFFQSDSLYYLLLSSNASLLPVDVFGKVRLVEVESGKSLCIRKLMTLKNSSQKSGLFRLDYMTQDSFDSCQIATYDGFDYLEHECYYNRCISLQKDLNRSTFSD